MPLNEVYLRQLSWCIRRLFSKEKILPSTVNQNKIKIFLPHNSHAMNYSEAGESNPSRGRLCSGCVLAASFWALIEHGPAIPSSLSYQSTHMNKLVHLVCLDLCLLCSLDIYVVNLRVSEIWSNWRGLADYCLAGLLRSQEWVVSF